MSNDLNNVVLTGRITRDVELRLTTSGTAIASFSLAVNEGMKRDGQWEEKANFFDIALWGKQAENLSRFLTKGKRVTVQGRLRQHTWLSPEGINRSKVVVNANFLQLLSPVENNNRPQQPQAPTVKGPYMHQSNPYISKDGNAGMGPELFENDPIPF